VGSLDLSAYDLVLSSSHCVAKGARVRQGAIHISYVHTPMRYAWGMLDHYFVNGRYGAVTRTAAAGALWPLRVWDRRTAGRVHHFVANSHNVAERVRKCYDREATVIYPPVETERFRPQGAREDFYLVVSALVPYKRVDIAVQAANLGGLQLVVAGEGSEMARLKRMARPSVKFLGRVSDHDLVGLYARARALLFAGEEDFGMVPVEAMSAGCPVVAFARGGARETVVDLADSAGGSPTGVLFDAQSPEALLAAVYRFESRREVFDPLALRAHAQRFDRQVFLRKMGAFVDEKVRGTA
jgi:glycosyltransferase involved in cell wall biosynthesis